MSKRLIEVDFPLRLVSEESVREKNIRHGHISTLHVWWARRPLAASRTTAFSALVLDDPDREDELMTLVKQLAPWENSLDARLLDKARVLIREAYDGRLPRVLDPFAGGGSIPMEAARLGCETYALDYNPVSVLINKAVLEFPQKYRQPTLQPRPGTLWAEQEGNRLLEDVRRWGKWVLDRALRDLGQFYPTDPDGSVPVCYVWARTLPCQNPVCGAEIPLMRQFVLAKKDDYTVVLKPRLDRNHKRVEFDVVEGPSADFAAKEGTVSRAHVRCPVCGTTLDDKTTRRLFRDRKAKQRMVAVVLRHAGRVGKLYRPPTENDIAVFTRAELVLDEKREHLRAEWGMDPLPDEEIPQTMPGGIHPPNYGLTTWGELFNGRQGLTLVTFCEHVRAAYRQMLLSNTDGEHAKVITTYLALAVDRLADFGSTLCVLNSTGGRGVVHTFGRPALQMVWDYAEANPFNPEGAGWVTACEKNEKWIQHAILSVDRSTPIVTITQGTATELPWADNYFDAVLTDPPYYINVPYSDLSDYFYVWLKRTVGELYPDLFATPLTAKKYEIGQMAHWDSKRFGEKDKRWFEGMLTKAFAEMNRVISPDGIAVIVFAYPRTEAWEAVINAVLRAGLYLTASWPIHTEMFARLMAQESAALASSIYMICRKRTVDDVGEYAQVRMDIAARVRQKLTQFWDEGIRGADFFMSAIGPAVEVFGRYARVEKLSGEEVRVSELLEYVEQVVAEFALQRVLESPNLGGVDAETRYYLLWRWTYGIARVEFDAANMLARAVGAEVSDLWNRSGFVQKDKEYVRVLGPKERARDARFMDRDRHDLLVDSLHKACILWETGQRQALSEHLALNRGSDETFWRVAQAISDVLPAGDKEKQLLQGLLQGKRVYSAPEQPKTLFELGGDEQ